MADTPRRGENIYKRKDGRWEGRIKKPNGGYQYVYAKTYREVKEKKNSVQLEGPSSPAQKSHPNAEASALFEHWLSSDVAGRVKQSTYENYYYCINKFVIPFFRNSENNIISESTTEQFVKSVYADNKISQAYKRKILSIFKTALKDIIKNQSDYSFIMQKVKLPKQENTEVQVFSVKEQRLIENEVLQSKDKRALGVLLCFYTGIRLGELCALKWEDFDIDSATLSIERTVSRIKNFQPGEAKTSLLVSCPKSKKSIRKIPLQTFLLDIFKKQVRGKDGSCFIFTGTDMPLDPRTYQKLYKEILKHAGVKDRKFHAIRHTFATRALELGVDIKTLSEILGHSTVSITLNIYTHSLFEQKRRAMDKLSQIHTSNVEISL